MHINPKKGDKGKHLNITPDYFPKSLYDYPVFCLKYIHRDFSLSACTDEEKGKLIERMHKLCGMTWEQIRQAQRHGLGQEIIPQEALRASKPQHITPDVNFYALRFDGLKPFIGYKSGFIFHIVYIDRNFNLYKHG